MPKHLPSRRRQDTKVVMQDASVAELVAVIRRGVPESSALAAQQLLPLVQAGTVEAAAGQLQSVLIKALASDDEDLVEACGQVLAELGKTRAPPPERTRTISLPSDGPSIRIRELADFEGDNHGAQVWTCAVLLSTALAESAHQEAHPRRRKLMPSPSGKRVLELGAGCGLCGLVAAKLGAKKVVITDCVERLNQNIAHNIQLQRDDALSATCTAQNLDWQEFNRLGNNIGSSAQRAGGGVGGSHDDILRPDSPAEQHHQYDMIIGSDLLLNEYSAVTLLPLVIARMLSPTGICVLSLAVRNQDTMASFRRALTKSSLQHSMEDQEKWLTDWLADFDGWDSIKRYPGGIVFVYIWHSKGTEIMRSS